ncbi:MAG: hypothetical protein A3C93_03040 [Candidatus Lloydbacteria bacterium RIFCSPHIGHO2_02_FULL_54_17]|uniref:THIF-type NAD/FAD binding fold domain-containing protein n=1 Tax=Candidatus Lloydbacteria bacterium RIFCSPHIGHO2_02_FULL_54_17 TaxID=1798664 RepID=A0A1G2DAJ7_9BACT|nr:MAG: hypothetical protein A2762_04910 [Candidatus Lloydbacteria bacterium RIFCSPHIGHO2_01_FULL_54_11]OGZ10644.1 MAG: hypothetical protein A3C93_03040 [Candidatus Lloydbacteria bacterium RIFCSPHIGHO2_02_FULL_54_17]OGZ13679.1 MAG: hypothetical protein A2948_03230 [Candidatus Lloydbacteria bacterium RIFCSPLOWO2_01_FULL_54_18]
MTVNVHEGPHGYTPLLFLGTKEGREEFASFRASWEKERGKLTLIDDLLREENAEYGLLLDPTFLARGEKPPFPFDASLDGTWVVYPWRSVAVHVLPEEAFKALRLSRNKDLITAEEGRLLASKTIAIAGLNVGNPAAICLAQEGIGNKFRMADNDTLALSNLNRFRAGLPDLGENKAVLSARQAYEIDPFLAIEVWPDGIAKDNLERFITDADIVVEEMDNLPLKILLREEARKKKKPVVMVTGNGHDIILDIERFDTTPDLPLLSGKLTKDVIDAVAKKLPFEEKIALARDFMGREYLSDRLNDSFDKVGKTLIGIPQLAEASFLRGAVLAHAIRDILLGVPVESGRYAFGLSQLYTVRS